MGGKAELGFSAGRAESGAVMLNRKKPSSTPARQHRSPGLTCFELASHALSRSRRTVGAPQTAVDKLADASYAAPCPKHDGAPFARRW
jgi:hypothetical protein